MSLKRKPLARLLAFDRFCAQLNAGLTAVAIVLLVATVIMGMTRAAELVPSGAWSEEFVLLEQLN